MVEVNELLMTSSLASNLGSVCIWNYRTGTCMHSYKNGGIVTSNAIAFIRDDYFIAAEQSKPLIHVWQVNSQETSKQLKIVSPGKVSALTVSPDGTYCAAGVGEQLYVWHIPSGDLLAIVAKHFQPIVKIIFTKDGSQVISAGEDGLVIIWRLNQLVNYLVSEQADPVHIIAEHSLPVRDICVSNNTRKTYIMSVSADCTLKIHQIDSGELLLSMVYNTGLTSVACNAIGTQVYVGTSDGPIYETSLLNPPRNKVYHADSDEERRNLFLGHTKNVTSLSVSVDGTSLASGSADCQVIIWHIPTKQKLKVIDHSAAITNVLFIVPIKNMFVEELKSTTVVNCFKRDLAVVDSNKKTFEIFCVKDIKLPFEDTTKNTVNPATKNVASKSELQEEINKLKHINSQLYNFSLRSILEQKSDELSDKNTSDSSFQSNRKKRKHKF